MSQVITSPDVVVVFNDGKTDELLVKLSDIIGKPIAAIIKDRAVMLGRYLAEITPPVVKLPGPLREGEQERFDGGSLAARNLQRFAIKRDLKRTYIGARAIFKQLNDQSAGDVGKAMAKKFWKAIRKSDIADARRILTWSGISAKSLTIGPWDDGARHRTLRNKSGRVNKNNAPVIVIDPKALTEYTKKIEKRAGFTKAGWINAASQVSTVGMSRVKGWIKVHTSSPGSGVDRTSNTAFPAVYLTNAVPWIDRCVSAKTIGMAETFFLNNLAKEVETQMARIIKKSEGKSK